MTMVSAGEEGRRCWMKVSFEGKWRKIIWNTTNISFQQLENKVKEMFHLNDKLKLKFKYIDSDSTVIELSHDEELSTALQLLTGDFLTIIVQCERKKNRMLLRTARNVNATGHYICDKLSFLPLAITTSLLSLLYLPRALIDRFPSIPNIRNISIRNIPLFKIIMILFYLQIAIFVLFFAHRVGHKLYQNHINKQQFNNHFQYVHQQHQHLHQQHQQQQQQIQQQIQQQQQQQQQHLQQVQQHQQQIQQHEQWTNDQYLQSYQQIQQLQQKQNQQQQGLQFTILGATYGGMDVTKQLQDYFTQHGIVSATNKVFGDPIVGSKKYLHIVYQQGAEAPYSQTVREPNEVGLSAHMFARENCPHQSEGVVDGKRVTILGALFDGVDATCAVKRFINTGTFSEKKYYNRGRSWSNDFNGGSGPGILTVVYRANNQVYTRAYRQTDGITF